MLLAYEKFDRMHAIVEAARQHLERGEFVIYTAPFRWMRCGSDDGEQEEVISGAYESMDAFAVCDMAGWKLVDSFGYFAICRETAKSLRGDRNIWREPQKVREALAVLGRCPSTRPQDAD